MPSKRNSQRSSRMRKGSVSRKTVKAMTAAAAIAGGTQAYAAPVRFDNPTGSGHFQWGAAGSNWLDVTHDAATQTNAASGSSFAQYLFAYRAYPQYSLYFDFTGVMGGDAQAVVGGVQSNYYPFPPYAYANGLPSGTIIPSGQLYQNEEVIVYFYTYYGYAYVFSNYNNYIPYGQNLYLGIQFNAADGVHNGWIGVNRAAGSLALDVFAWGYETTAGASIAAGAAGSSGPLLGDMNNDGVVDASDVPAFVDALLGVSLPPGSVDRSDMNGDTHTDGDDIPPFINAAIH